MKVPAQALKGYLEFQRNICELVMIIFVNMYLSAINMLCSGETNRMISYYDEYIDIVTIEIYF